MQQGEHGLSMINKDLATVSCLLASPQQSTASTYADCCWLTYFAYSLRNARTLLSRTLIATVSPSGGPFLP